MDYERCILSQQGIHEEEDMARLTVPLWKHMQCRKPAEQLSDAEVQSIEAKAIATIVAWPKGYRYKGDPNQPNRPYDPDRPRSVTIHCTTYGGYGYSTTTCY